MAESVSDKCLEAGRMYPRLKDIREMSVRIAIAIGEYCYEVRAGGEGIYRKIDIVDMITPSMEPRFSCEISAIGKGIEQEKVPHRLQSCSGSYGICKVENISFSHFELQLIEK